MNYDIIIKDKLIIHKDIFDNKKFLSHKLKKHVNVNIYECINCKINIIIGDLISVAKDSSKNILIMECFIIGSKDNFTSKYDLSCDEMIIKNIIE